MPLETCPVYRHVWNAPSYIIAQVPPTTKKHAVRFIRSTNPLCPLPGYHQVDSALHMLSGCQNHIISSKKTECHNIAGRMIIKALSKSPRGAGLVSTDIGSDDRLAQHNLQIPAH
eukprot:473639-Pelagomonas_calceolata.AAC.1